MLGCSQLEKEKQISSAYLHIVPIALSLTASLLFLMGF